jgi:MoaA/NifB/PqqE/SkfB family radical SAM enzyme
MKQPLALPEINFGQPEAEHDALAIEESFYEADIVLVVTTVCNLRCVMCPQGMREVKNPAHTSQEIIGRCESFLEQSQRVILSGIGEAMLSPAFWSTIAALKDKRFGVLRLHTNGHFVSEDNAVRLLDSGLSLLMISLDAATPATYRKIRGSDLEIPLVGIRRLVALRKKYPRTRLQIAITMTLMRDNVTEAAEFITLARLLDVDTAIFSQIFPFGDRPDWIVPRDGGDFVYADQMLEPIRKVVTRHLNQAIAEAEKSAVKVVFHDNVDSYL